MTTPTCPELPELRAGESEECTIDFGARLIGSETLSGTPTVVASSTLLTLSNKAINGADVTIGPNTIEANTGVQWLVVVSTGITTTTKYYFTATATTSGSPARTLVEVVSAQVVV